MSQKAPPPRIQIFDSFFDRKLFGDMTLAVADLRWRPGWKSSKEFSDYTQFHADFTNTDATNRVDSKDKLKGGPHVEALARAWAFIQEKAIGRSHALLRCYANLNVFGTEGYPHRDTDPTNIDDLTCVFYGVHGKWPLGWGGETVVCHGEDIIKSVMPRENRLFLFPSRMTHIARGVTRACPEPRVTLIWKSAPA